MLRKLLLAALSVLACTIVLVSCVYSNDIQEVRFRKRINDLRVRGSEGAMPRLPYGTAPLNATQLPQILSTRTDRNKDSQSIDSIRNKLAVYSYAVDGKEFLALDQVFSASAVANYSSSLGVLSGGTVIRDALTTEFAGPTTQHLLGSTFVLFSDLRDAFSVTGFQITTLASNCTSQVFGQFQDSWFRRSGRTQDWKIAYRNVIWTG